MKNIVSYSSAKTQQSANSLQGSVVQPQPQQNFTQIDIDRAVENLSDRFDDLISQYNITTKRGQCHCPDPSHDDNKPSAHAYRDHIHCFGCGETWYAPKLIGMLENEQSFIEQLKIGHDILGIPLPLEAGGWQAPQAREAKQVKKTYKKIDPSKIKIQDVGDRHAGYQELLKRVGLTGEHRQNLRDRGLTDQQIQDLGFASVERYEYVGQIRFPGISNGKVIASQPGFLCPARQYGSVVAAQIRTADKTNKYKWLSASQDYQIDVGGDRTESPLSFLIGENPDRPLLSEGFLKTDIIHLITGRTCIGAAGGNWLSGEGQILDFIKRYNPIGFDIFADAESASNPAVAKRTYRQIQQLQEMGLSVRIADYGQLISKDLPSPDDWLVSLDFPGDWENQINWLNVDDFRELAIANDVDFPKPPTHKGFGKVTITKAEWNKKHSNIREEWEKEQDELRAIAKAQRDEKLQEWRDAYETRILANYVKGVKVSNPDVTLDQQYLEFASLLKFFDVSKETLRNYNIVLDSGTGTGKTELIKALIKIFADGCVFTYRNSIGQNMHSRIPEIEYIWDDEFAIEIDVNDRKTKKIQASFNRANTKRLKKSTGWIVGCVNSSPKLAKKPIYVIEESSKVLSEMYLSNTLKYSRSKVLIDFEEKTSTSDLNIWLDADNSDVDVTAIERITGRKCLVIQNLHQTMKFNIDWYIGTTKINARDFSSELLPNNKAALEQELLNQIEAGKNILVCSDSQIYLESLQRLINDLFPAILCNRVDSHTKGDNEQGANEYLGDPNEWIAHNRPRVTLLSPTGEASLDITFEHYDAVFGFYLGVMTPYGIRQHLCRYRLPAPRFVWVKEWARTNGALLPEKCNQELWRKNKGAIETLALARNHQKINEVDLPTYLESLEKVVDRDSGEWRDPHLLNWADYAARDNYHRRHLREIAKQLLEKAGHTIVGEFSQVAESHTGKLTKDIKLERSEKIATAQLCTESEAKILSKRRDLTSQERWELYRYNLSQIIPGDLSQEMVYEVKFQNKSLLPGLKALWMLHHRDDAKTINSDRIKTEIANADPLWDLSSTATLTARLGEMLNIAALIDSFSTFEIKADSPEVIEFIEKCKKFKRQIWLTWRINLCDDTDPIRFINLILKKFAHHIKPRPVRQDGDRFRVYRCVPLSEFHVELYDRVCQSQKQKVTHIVEKENISLFQRCVPKEIIKKKELASVAAAAVSEVGMLSPATDELDMWGMVWSAIAVDDAFETFGYVWQAVKDMGAAWAEKVAEELPEVIKAIDPETYQRYVF